MQHFLYENHTFQGQFLHYLVIFNRKLEILMGIYNAYCGTADKNRIIGHQHVIVHVNQ